MEKEKITFSFGENWKDFISQIDEDNIKQANDDIIKWLGDAEAVKGKRVIDIGSGSGIHSYNYYKMGAKELISFDYDKSSVESTKLMWKKAGSPSNWKVMQGSVLDKTFLDTLGTFDIVYSWGVLHHTGEMWKAIGNSSVMVNPGGIYWIAIYQKGPRYEADLAYKRKYNNSSFFGKKFMLYERIFHYMMRLYKRGKNPFKWNQKVGRGMYIYHDMIDWLGGLPYEVATKDEIETFCSQKGLHLEKSHIASEGGCSVYLLKK